MPRRFLDLELADVRQSQTAIAERVRTAEPSIEPVTLAELRAQARVDADFTDDDAILTNLIIAARTHLEDLCGRSFITQTWRFRWDGFPNGYAPIFVPRPPLISITSLSYIDLGNVTNTLVENTDFRVDLDSIPARVVPMSNQVWPYVRWPYFRDEIATVTMIAQCGYGATAASVPMPLRLAILMLAAYWYDHPASAEIEVGGKIVEIPRGLTALISEYRMRRFA